MLESQQRGVHALEALKNQGYEYRLERYVASLSELTIRASKPDSPGFYIRITFQTTLYVQMPTYWTQGDFCLATTDRYMKLVTELGLGEDQTKQLLLFTVYPAQTPEIYVLCHQVFLSQEIPVPWW